MGHKKIFTNVKIYVGLDRQSSNLILKDLGQISKLSEQLEAL